MKIAVIGGGAWGTALAHVFAAKGLETRLWARNESVIAAIRDHNENIPYLPGAKLDDRIQPTSDRAEAAEGADCFVVAIPSQFFRNTLREFKKHLPHAPNIVCANKGIELGTLSLMSDVVAEELADLSPRFAMLSGPSFAREVCKGVPTTVSLGCADTQLGKQLQQTLSSGLFRVYTNADYKGVELGGALKNIIAIAAGCADGLEFGHNARAAIITRGLAEMGRLGKALGARPETFHGLSGLGDLVLTCTGDLSRNRQVGLALGRGKSLNDILKEMKAVAEGVKTTESVHHLAQKLGVAMPITDMLYRVIHDGMPPREAVHELMTRTLTDE